MFHIVGKCFSYVTRHFSILNVFKTIENDFNMQNC